MGHKFSQIWGTFLTGTDKLTYAPMRILENSPPIAPQHISKTQRHPFVETGSAWLKPSDDQD